MARIAGVDLPREKRVEIALTYIYGIGMSRSSAILATANVNQGIRVKDLTEDEISRIRKVIQDSEMVEGDLRQKIQMDIRRLIDIGSYRGIRHRVGLPVRGQRTHTNARHHKGPRRAISGKKRAPKK